MEEDTQYFQGIMLYYFEKGKSPTEMEKKKKICAVYGEGAVTDRKMSKAVCRVSWYN